MESSVKELMMDQTALAAFKARLRGALLLPGDPIYEENRSVWNAMIDRRPALIVRCLGTSDVLASVDFARRQGLPISIKGGGHNIAGLAASEGGLLLDMSLMRGVRVDPQARTAHAQPGCLLGDVDRETQVHGLAAPLGFISQTGAAGLTLGGGFGYLTRRAGWTCDNVLSMEVVTADGRVVRASETENPDLLWGLRGGGGNFGVVTDFEYALQPVGPEVVAGAIAWDISYAQEVLAMYASLIREASPEMTWAAILRIAPPAPWIAKEYHGKPIVILLACHSGDVAAGEKAVAAVKAFGKPVGDVLQRRSYVSQQSLLDATQPKGRRNYWKAENLPGFTMDMAPDLIEHAQAIPSPFSVLVLFSVDGALNRLPQDYSAVGNRDVKVLLNIATAWEKVEDDEANIGWVRDAWQDLRRFSTGGVYINFQSQDEGQERIHAAYGKNYERLVEVKRAWDPENLFRMNKNIVP